MKFDSGIDHLRLELTLFNEQDGATSTHRFDQFPIRIGRNPHNDLRLDHAYVSQWHGAIGFMGGELKLLQVGTGNGIRVDNRKLRPNESISLNGSEVLQLMPYRITLKVVPQKKHSGHSEVGTDAITGPVMAQKGESGRQVERLCASLIRLEQGRIQLLETLGASLSGDQNHSIFCGSAGAREIADALRNDRYSERELDQALSTLVAHQLAVLEGVMAGVRALIAELSPKKIAEEAARSHRLVGSRVLWQTYERIYADLAEEGQETFDTIFGPRFAAVYAESIGAKDPRGSKG